METAMKKSIFVDFDGTVTKADTCAAMVDAFAKGDWERLNRLWEKKELSTEECANLTFQMFRATPEDIKELVESIDIDEYFKVFLAFCRERGYRVYVLSDGYDFNIRTVFAKHDIDLPYYANRLVYENGFRIKCQHGNPDCETCGTCKTRLMEQLREEGSQVVYIGDGYSDTCPAAKADVVFAKGALYEYCLDQGIPAFPFKDFSDVMRLFK